VCHCDQLKRGVTTLFDYNTLFNRCVTIATKILLLISKFSTTVRVISIFNCSEEAARGWNLIILSI
jgi:hypothetical protein